MEAGRREQASDYQKDPSGLLVPPAEQGFLAFPDPDDPPDPQCDGSHTPDAAPEDIQPGPEEADDSDFGPLFWRPQEEPPSLEGPALLGEVGQGPQLDCERITASPRRSSHVRPRG